MPGWGRSMWYGRCTLGGEPTYPLIPVHGRRYLHATCTDTHARVCTRHPRANQPYKGSVVGESRSSLRRGPAVG
eukprot:1480694-Prymnesium_polylepis.1